MFPSQPSASREPIQKPGFFWQTAQILQAALARNPVSRNTESVF